MLEMLENDRGIKTTCVTVILTPWKLGLTFEFVVLLFRTGESKERKP
jgi:hypothetical protein